MAEFGTDLKIKTESCVTIANVRLVNYWYVALNIPSKFATSSIFVAFWTYERIWLQKSVTNYIIYADYNMQWWFFGDFKITSISFL